MGSVNQPTDQSVQTGLLKNGGNPIHELLKRLPRKQKLAGGVPGTVDFGGCGGGGQTIFHARHFLNNQLRGSMVWAGFV